MNPVSPQGFAAWACDAARTLEERFGAEVLIEQCLKHWNSKHGIPTPAMNFEAERLRLKDRLLNPAYEPRFSRPDAERTQEVLPDVKSFGTSSFEDRPIRDLSFVRFCHGLTAFEIRQCEVTDWSPLLSQPTLTELKIWGTTARDLRCLGQLSRLQSLRLWANAPWPNLEGLENLHALRELYFHGNILALRDIPRLPRLQVLEVHHAYEFKLPLRSVADLPDAPELRRLHLDNTAELHGLERYHQLLNADLYGYYSDLAPLVALQQLTHLTLSDGDYASFAPLTKLSQLRRLVIRREEPPDFTALAEAPRLHEIELEISPITPVELTSLRALLPPWREAFAAPTPRPLGPLQLVLGKHEPEAHRESRAEPRDWGDDVEMAKSEYVWFCRETNRRLTRLLGKGWGAESNTHRWVSTNMHVNICRPQDLDRIPEIVQALRETLATTRHPWSYFLVIDPEKWYEREMDEIYAAEGEEFDAEREREDWEDQKARERERREFLERKYRHRLQQETGLPASPEEFAPPKPEATEAGATEADEADTVYSGAAPEPEAYNLVTNISLYATLTEQACHFNEHFVAGAKYYLGYKTEP